MDNLNEKMMQNLKFTAIRSLSADAQFNISAEGVVTFLEGSPKFTDKQIKTEMTRLQEVWDSIQYKNLRANEYPPIVINPGGNSSVVEPVVNNPVFPD